MKEARNVPHHSCGSAHWQEDGQELVHTSTVTACVRMCARVQELKKQVVKVPARSTTRAEMAAVEREIVDLQQQGAELGVAVQAMQEGNHICSLLKEPTGLSWLLACTCPRTPHGLRLPPLLPIAHAHHGLRPPHLLPIQMPSLSGERGSLRSSCQRCRRCTAAWRERCRKRG